MSTPDISIDDLYRIYKESKAVKTPRDFEQDNVAPGDLYVAWRMRYSSPGGIVSVLEDIWCFLEYYSPFLLKPIRHFIDKYNDVSGFMVDWNATAQAALRRGAHVAVVDDRRARRAGTNCILVEDSRATLKSLAVHHRRHMDTTFIGITGSCGKTTTKELVHSVLGAQYRVECTQDTFNTPLYAQKTLLNLDEATELGVMEMGADTFGQLQENCEVVQPSCGLITCIGKAHLENFDSIEGVLTAKTELFDYLRSTGGHIFKNLNDSRLAPLLQDYERVTTYGSAEDADVRGTVVGTSPSLTIRWYPSRRSNQEHFDVATKLFGEYNLDNVLAAIAAGLHFDVPPASINESLQECETLALRSQTTTLGTNTVIQDTYNANPTSMRAALDNFSHLETAGKVAILGDMLELGRASRQEHRDLISYAKQVECDQVVFVGKEFTQARDASFGRYFRNVRQARRWLVAQHWTDTHILLKASRGIALERLMSGLQDPGAQHG